MWIIEMDGEFQAMFALECDAWSFRASRMALFPEKAIAILHTNADAALMSALAGA